MGEPLGGAFDHQLERDLGLRDPAHAVREARRAQPYLAELVTAAALAEHRGVGHAHVVEADLAVVVAPRHRLDVAHDLEARRVGVDDERAVAGPGVGGVGATTETAESLEAAPEFKTLSQQMAEQNAAAPVDGGTTSSTTGAGGMTPAPAE